MLWSISAPSRGFKATEEDERNQGSFLSLHPRYHTSSVPPSTAQCRPKQNVNLPWLWLPKNPEAGGWTHFPLWTVGETAKWGRADQHAFQLPSFPIQNLKNIPRVSKAWNRDPENNHRVGRKVPSKVYPPYLWDLPPSNGAWKGMSNSPWESQSLVGKKGWQVGNVLSIMVRAPKGWEQDRGTYPGANILPPSFLPFLPCAW